MSLLELKISKMRGMAVLHDASNFLFVPVGHYLAQQTVRDNNTSILIVHVVTRFLLIVLIYLLKVAVGGIGIDISMITKDPLLQSCVKQPTMIPKV